MRCTGVLPYHTCPHHLRWRWFSSPRSGRVSLWFCCRADRSGPASGSGRPGSSCGFRCKTWNQQSSAGTPAQRRETRGNRERERQRMRKHKNRQRQTVRHCQDKGVDSNMFCFFYGPYYKKNFLLQGLKKLRHQLGNCGLDFFNISHLAFKWHIWYASHGFTSW